MKKIILYLLLISSQGLSAQEVLSTTFHNDKDEEVSPKKSVYTRVIKSTSEQSTYSFTETWKDGALKRTGFVSEYKPKFKQKGKEITYHKNGEISSIQYIRYLNTKMNIGDTQTSQSVNMSVGNIETFYENGKPKETGEFQKPTSKNTANRFNYPNYIVKQITDSLGNVFLDSSGTGKVNITFANGNSLQGEYLNGLKHGLIKEFDAKNKETYIENFENGKLLNGRYINETGKEIKYDTLETHPEFKGGLKEFANFLKENLKYPPDMRKQRVEGRVNIKFVVEKDGSVKKLEIIKGIEGGRELEMEALRVMYLSPKWKPGVQRGKTVRVSYTVPIVFKLS